jgi:hypothetical protein
VTGDPCDHCGQPSVVTVITDVFVGDGYVRNEPPHFHDTTWLCQHCADDRYSSAIDVGVFPEWPSNEGAKQEGA